LAASIVPTNKLACLAAGGDVIGADIHQTVGLRRVGVMRDQHGLGSDFVENGGRVIRIDRADGDAGNTLGE
jgi:hypothetical protein